MCQEVKSTLFRLVLCYGLMNPFVDLTKSARNTTALVEQQVVPDVIDTIPNDTIEIEYDSGARVDFGNELTPTQVKDLPEFKFNASSDQLYTLAIVDPDAPSRAEPTFRELVHFLVSNIPGSDVSKGDTLAAFIGAAPPKGTNLHRYVTLVYRQEGGKLVSDIDIPVDNSMMQRVNFSIRKFASHNNLSGPIAGNFFQAQYDDYVPILTEQIS